MPYVLVWLLAVIVSALRLTVQRRRVEVADGVVAEAGPDGGADGTIVYGLPATVAVGGRPARGQADAGRPCRR